MLEIDVSRSISQNFVYYILKALMERLVKGKQ